jgi:hypothetical protein
MTMIGTNAIIVKECKSCPSGASVAGYKVGTPPAHKLAHGSSMYLQHSCQGMPLLPFDPCSWSATTLQTTWRAASQSQVWLAGLCKQHATSLGKNRAHLALLRSHVQFATGADASAAKASDGTLVAVFTADLPTPPEKLMAAPFNFVFAIGEPCKDRSCVRVASFPIVR